MRSLALTVALAVLGCRSARVVNNTPPPPQVRNDAPDVPHVFLEAQATPTERGDAGAEPAPQAEPECTTDRDCRMHGRVGRCFTPALAAQYTQAFRDCPEGRAWRAAHTPGTCVYDECRDDGAEGDTCGPGRRCGYLEMVPFPQRVCVDAACNGHGDCRRGAGRCMPYLAGGRCVRGGWACSYPQDRCVPRDPVRMCPVRAGVLSFCAPREGRFTCVEEPVVVAPDAAE